MAIVQGMCTSFKAEQLAGMVHDLLNDDIRMAIYEEAATLDASTTEYTAVGEVTGPGYVAGGMTMTGFVVAQSGNVAFADADDVVWDPVTITGRGALIYNFSKSNKAIAVINFGANKSSTNGPFTVVVPAADATNALLRFGAPA